jgi:hypothetical protein
MIGEIVPLVLIPRFSSFVGANEFTSEPYDAAEFSTGSVELWRGQLKGTSSPTFLVFIETSNDKNVWTPQNPSGDDPGANASMPISITLGRRWLRARIVLTGTNPAVTCWCAGTLTRRVR